MAFVPAPSTAIAARPYSAATEKPATGKLVATVMPAPEYEFAGRSYNPTVTVIPPQMLAGVLIAAPTVTKVVVNTGAKSVGYAG